MYLKLNNIKMAESVAFLLAEQEAQVQAQFAVKPNGLDFRL